MIPKPEVDWQRMSVRVADHGGPSAYKLRPEDYEQVRRYALEMEAGATFPPIRIANVRGRMHVVDGYHRLAASRHCGRETIDAEVGKMTASTARAWAIDSNAKNGLPLTSSDRKPIFAMYMKGNLHLDANGKTKSRRTIAQELASSLGTLLSPATVRVWMEQYRETQFEYDPDMPKADRRFDEERVPDADRIDDVNAALVHIKRLYWEVENTDSRESIKRALTFALEGIDSPIYIEEDDDPDITFDI